MDRQRVLRRLMTLTVSACKDEPVDPKFRVEDGCFVFTLVARQGLNETVQEVVRLMGVPPSAELTMSNEASGATLLTYRWPSHGDAIFQPGGILSRTLDHYEMRSQQLYMARLIQRSVEMGQNLIAEAPTGTGKSFTYLAVGLAMGLRIIVSTSNKSLQAQLYKRDAPFLRDLLAPDARIVLAQGKNNYVCLTKAYDEAGKAQFEHPALADWLESAACTGNLEDLTFGLPDDVREAVNVDSTCTKSKCPRFHDCYYYEERAKRQDAEIIICNHSLLIMNELYPMAHLLPGDVGLVVVDEAHQLTQFTRNALGEEFQLGRQFKVVESAAKHAGQDASDAFSALYAYVDELRGLVGKRRLDVMPLDDFESERYVLVRTELSRLATAIWPDGAEPETKDDMKAAARAAQIRNVRDRLRRLSYPKEGDIRWLDLPTPGMVDDQVQCHIVPHDVAHIIGMLTGFVDPNLGPQPDPAQCSYCAAPHGRTVHTLNGFGLCADCAAQVDVENEAQMVSLDEWLHIAASFQGLDKEQSRRPPVVFCSATLASPTFSTVKREWGVRYALELIVDSPFDYKRNAAIYIPTANAPAPNGSDNEQHMAWLIAEVKRLVRWSGGGAFVLFTSYRAMNQVAEATRPGFEAAGMATYVQGELPKVEMVKQFAAAEHGVLYGTRSFFEGVDVKGAALRLVILDRLPFEPLTPLRAAEDRALVQWAEENLTLKPGELEWYPFNQITVPRMVVDLKQVFGRLIRTQTDYGVFAVLDNRARTRPYGRRQVLPALPRCPDLWSMEQVADFYYQRGANGNGQVTLTSTEAALAKALYQA